MGNVTYGQFNSLPITEKAYWAHMAKTKNDEIRAEVESVKRKLQAYDKVGPLYVYPPRLGYLNGAATSSNTLLMVDVPFGFLSNFGDMMGGSTDKHLCVEVSDLSDLLNSPGPNLADMFKSDNGMERTVPTRRLIFWRYIWL